MLYTLLLFYGYVIFFYSLALIGSYIALLIMAYIYSNNYRQWSDDYIKHMVDSTPYVPGVSIVAPAYNEEKSIVENVNSLLRQDYPNFEIVIVNDGSKDKTLELLIENFEMVEVPYDYIEHIHCKPFKRLFRSTNYKFSRLVVVDKINGGTKADAVNGGLNVVSNPYFINTDVDCILSKDAIYHCIFPVLLDDSVIAVSGTMSMSNGSTVEDGTIIELNTSSKPIPLFQDLEYKRSFLIGKMGWSCINAMNNVSGGYGLFNTQIVIAAGGYGSDSFAEDMDMLFRMIGYCCDFNRQYRVVQIPHNCCWTEGPSNVKTLVRQRVRWGRGLIQLVCEHSRMLLNPKYKTLGMLTFPYTFLFEFLAPIIEFVGTCLIIFLAFTGGVNWDTFFVMFGAIFLFSVMLSSFVVFYDYLLGSSYYKSSNYLKLLLAGLLEPICYHPIIVYSSIRGYYNYLIRKKAVWGEMNRQGVKRAKAPTASSAVPISPTPKPTDNL